MRTIPLSRPDTSDLEHRYLREVLRSDRLAMGPFLERFEAHMARQCGTRHAVAVSSGTAALHLIARGLDLGEGDEVITTPFSFIASANVLLYVGARPRFVDIDPATLCLDVARAAEAVSPATRGLLAVDVFGLPADWPGLTELVRQHGLSLIDDACHALGATAGGRPVGSWGDAAAFGFYPNKQITTGEGGCITTDSDELAALCRSLRNQGRTTDEHMEHVRLGYNYRMSELTAALGCAQMERLPDLLRRRAEVAAWYKKALSPLRADLVLPNGAADATRSWFVYVVRLADHFAPDARDLLMRRLNERGVECAPYFPSIHLQPYYRERFGFEPGDFPACEAASARTLALPFFPALEKENVAYVAESIKAVLPKLPVLTASISASP